MTLKVFKSYRYIYNIQNYENNVTSWLPSLALWQLCNCTAIDLRIVRCDKPRKLITKELKYRESSSTCWGKAMSPIIDGMNGVVEQLHNKLDINKLQFSECKNAILSHIDFQISKCKNKFQYQKM